MTNPSLSDQAGGAVRRLAARVPWPKSYAPALAVLALVPGTIALFAAGLALRDTHRGDLLVRAEAPRLAAIATMRRRAAARAAMAPALAAPTLTRTLAEVVTLLPPDATLHGLARERDGVTRIEVDCLDPDALLRAFRPPASALAWRSVAQSVTVGNGVRVTLEARLR